MKDNCCTGLLSLKLDWTETRGIGVGGQIECNSNVNATKTTNIVSHF